MANHKHHRPSYRQAVPLLAVLAAVWLAGGCQGQRRNGMDNADALAAPVQPTWQRHAASALIAESPQASVQPCSIQDIVLSYLNTGRHFDAPDPNADPIEDAAPQGYVLRVIPLDATYRAICLTGTAMRISLYAADADTSARPLMNWIIAPEDLNAYWTRTQLLDGYLVRLSWGTHDPSCGDYILSVTLDCSTPDRSRLKHKTLYFSDILRRP